MGTIPPMSEYAYGGVTVAHAAEGTGQVDDPVAPVGGGEPAALLGLADESIGEGEGTDVAKSADMAWSR